MSKITDRDAPQGADGSVENRLARFLDSPVLARVVPYLPPETLHQLIRHRGLDACGDIVTSATPAQLTALLDLDLWRHDRPGHDEQFDFDRFGEWLEVLVDTGDTVAAHTVAALDSSVVIAGLSRYIRVFDPGIFEPTAQSDDEMIARHDAMREGDVLNVDESGERLECEVGGYLVRARRTDAWGAIITILTALEDEHTDYFHAAMRGCRRLSNSNPEIDGLDDILSVSAQHLHDVAIGREQRRTDQGYATPADARAFLQMARHPSRSEANPIAVAYFRAAAEAPAAGDAPSPSMETPPPLTAVVELLTEAGMMPQQPRALLGSAEQAPQSARLPHLRRVLEFVRDSNHTAYFDRQRELAFLANVLLSGCSVQSRPFTPQEASDAAAGICNLGIEYCAAPDSFLIDRNLIAAFEEGWLVLHRDVSMFVAHQLIELLGDIRSVDRDIQRELIALRRKLSTHCEAGTPWLARNSADVLAMLDTTAWISVIGLLDECPVLPAALTAILDGQTTTVSATAFEFIATGDQIGEVRSFMSKLPGLLRR